MRAHIPTTHAHTLAHARSQVLETFADDEKKAEFENSKQFVIHPAEPTDKTEPRLGSGARIASDTSTWRARARQRRARPEAGPLDSRPRGGLGMLFLPTRVHRGGGSTEMRLLSAR